MRSQQARRAYRTQLARVVRRWNHLELGKCVVSSSLASSNRPRLGCETQPFCYKSMLRSTRLNGWFRQPKSSVRCSLSSPPTSNTTIPT
eukprot:2679466-Pyramimonas_sp.AAC.1